ncbi:acylphosphatase [Phenylobacterium sp. J426]|uniref:acylphosphatase n=1 Tax=Phenylobacterium sp. J426 TaxID=2898439 RepID=UPI0021512B73|nr:acylphosphatase [Phenylobacterium sp. J426]MCR5873822.1 acylphosphatase [Phenylobacterium sp. J426]
MAETAAVFRIEGRVQGVGYRWWAAGQARSLSLRGWVRNRREGWVELMAIGGADAVAALERACARGPEAARVTAVIRAEADDDGSVDFSEKATV